MASIEGLLKRLKACENDSEKFALLIVISKVIKPDLMSPELQEKLSEAVSFKFISRLLKVETSRENAGLYWQIAVAVLKTCFLSRSHLTSLSECADRLLHLSVESKDKDIQQDVSEIFHFLAHSLNPDQVEHILGLLLSNLLNLENIVTWCSLIKHMFSKLHLEEHSETVKMLISATETIINSVETESPTSVDKNLNLLVSAVQLTSITPFLHHNIPNFTTALSCIENLLKSKIPSDKRQVLLKVAPFLTELHSCTSWGGTKLCYSLTCIELKLALEELVHRHEESGQSKVSGQNEVPGQNEVSESCLELVVICCETIENCINEMVDENCKLEGSVLQGMIDDIRMAMSSAMFYLQKCIHDQITFVPVLRLFMRWLSDDSADVTGIIATFTALKDFYMVPSNYSNYGSFLVSAVIFQMEDKKFRDFVKTDLAYFLLEISLRGLVSSEPLLLAPIFNDLLTYDIFLNLKKLTDKAGICTSLEDVFSLENNVLSSKSLCQIQLCSYLILCLTKRNLPLQSVCQHNSVSQWTCKAINYLITPFKDEEPSLDWVELKDIWFSSLHSICELIEKSNEEIMFDAVDMDVLVKKSANYSEIGDEISGAFEGLLSLIVGAC